MSTNNPSPHSGPTTTSSTATESQPTQPIQQNGSIHTTPLDALRIVAATTFHTFDDPFIRIYPDDQTDSIGYSIGISATSIRDQLKSAVILQGQCEDYLRDGSNSITIMNRVLFQTSFPSGQPFRDFNWGIQQHDKAPDFLIQFVDSSPAGWKVHDSVFDIMIAKILNDGFSLITRLSTLRDIVNPHPSQTLPTAEPQSKIMNTDTPSEQTSPSRQHIKHFLETGECPAHRCEKSFDSFSELTGHVGGKIRHEIGGGPHHMLNLDRDDVDIEAIETEPTNS